MGKQYRLRHKTTTYIWGKMAQGVYIRKTGQNNYGNNEEHIASYILVFSA